MFAAGVGGRAGRQTDGRAKAPLHLIHRLRPFERAAGHSMHMTRPHKMNNSLLTPAQATFSSDKTSSNAPTKPNHSYTTMNGADLLSGKADEAILIWECLSYPDQQRLACTCKALNEQYASPLMKSLRDRAEELFYLSIINRKDDAKMRAYVRAGKYQCRLINCEGSYRRVDTFDTLKDALTFLCGELIRRDELDEYFYPYLDNLLEEELDGNDHEGGGVKPKRQRRERPTCSATFCHHRSNPNEIDRLYSLKGKAFCFDCIQELPLALQFYVHFGVRGLDEQEFTWEEVKNDQDGYIGSPYESESDETVGDNKEYEYNVRFYYDHEYTADSNDFRLVGIGDCGWTPPETDDDRETDTGAIFYSDDDDDSSDEEFDEPPQPT